MLVCYCRQEERRGSFVPLVELVHVARDDAERPLTTAEVLSILREDSAYVSRIFSEFSPNLTCFWSFHIRPQG